MTDPITIDAGVVGFNLDERIITGMLLPYGEECRSSVGRFAFDEGAVQLPVDVPGTVGLNVEHARETPVGRGVTLTPTPAGILGAFRVAEGADGDAALADVASGKRKHLSAEVKGLRIKGGRGIAAQLFGAALVERPAFPSAALFAAADTDDAAPDTDPDDPPADDEEVLNESSTVDEWTDEDGKTWTRTSTSRTVKRGAETTTTTTHTLAEPEGADDTNREDAAMTAPATGFAAATPTTPDVGLFAFARAIVEARRVGNNRPLEAIIAESERIGLFALADQTYDQTGDVASPTNRVPQYLTDIWEGDIVEGLAYSEHFDDGDLTDMVFKQRQITQRPLVDKWTGNKTDIPSRAAKVTTVEKPAQRFAGGLDIAREHYDFGKVEDVALILQLMGESYRLNSEAYVGEELRAAATPLTVDPAAVPADITAAHYKLVRGALAVLRQGRALPSVAFVADDLYDQLMFTPKDGGLEYLTTTLGLTAGTVEQVALVPDSTMPAGSVLVAARKAVQVLTLPGSPIRVNALDIARGGVDEALFGYVGVRTRRASALQLVSDAPVAP